MITNPDNGDARGHAEVIGPRGLIPVQNHAARTLYRQQLAGCTAMTRESVAIDRGLVNVVVLCQKARQLSHAEDKEVAVLWTQEVDVLREDGQTMRMGAPVDMRRLCLEAVCITGHACVVVFTCAGRGGQFNQVGHGPIWSPFYTAGCAAVHGARRHAPGIQARATDRVTTRAYARVKQHIAAAGAAEVARHVRLGQRVLVV